MNEIKDMRSELASIFSREARIDAGALSGSTTLEQMDVASVDMVMIVYAIEEDLGVELTMDDLSRDMTFDGLAALVDSRRGDAV